MKNFKKYISQNSKSLVYGILCSVLCILICLGSLGFLIYSALVWSEEIKGLFSILFAFVAFMLAFIVGSLSIVHTHEISLKIKSEVKNWKELLEKNANDSILKYGDAQKQKNEFFDKGNSNK